MGKFERGALEVTTIPRTFKQWRRLVALGGVVTHNVAALYLVELSILPCPETKYGRLRGSSSVQRAGNVGGRGTASTFSR